MIALFKRSAAQKLASCGSAIGLILLVVASPAVADGSKNTAFTRALAEAAASDESLSAFYRQNGYDDLWTGPDDTARRAAALQAFSQAAVHGLPTQRYDANGLIAQFQNAQTEGDRGRLEVAMSAAYLYYARDLSSGALTPAKVDPGIVREIIRPDPTRLLTDMAAAPQPARFLRDLAPSTPEYGRLLKEKLALEAVVSAGGWGPQLGGSVSPDADSNSIVALRNLLINQGYLHTSAVASYDGSLMRAVQRFQLDHGITADGIAGPSTIAALNVPAEDRLKSVVVALERLRWMGDAPRGKRHIWVNLPEFEARIIDDGRTTFETRAVIGKDVEDQRSPEFSDVMGFMVINPSWGVPRSIIVKEYLPLLQRNRNAVEHLQVIDRSGRVVPRGAVNFASYSASSFPFGLRQPPSDGNALGKVKFMFPNKHNIYLHDTPAKNLFEHEVRAYSHGCIRLGDPMDFAYTLLSKQTDDPKGLFKTELDSKKESSVNLEQKVPVHLVYFTAWPTEGGRMSYRPDVYGRDGRLFDALQDAGVVLTGVQG